MQISKHCEIVCFVSTQLKRRNFYLNFNYRCLHIYLQRAKSTGRKLRCESERVFGDPELMDNDKTEVVVIIGSASKVGRDLSIWATFSEYIGLILIWHRDHVAEFSICSLPTSTIFCGGDPELPTEGLNCHESHVPKDLRLYYFALLEVGLFLAFSDFDVSLSLSLFVAHEETDRSLNFSHARLVNSKEDQCFVLRLGKSQLPSLSAHKLR